jgi:hypothetical protein
MELVGDNQLLHRRVLVEIEWWLGRGSVVIVDDVAENFSVLNSAAVRWLRNGKGSSLVDALMGAC